MRTYLTTTIAPGMLPEGRPDLRLGIIEISEADFRVHLAGLITPAVRHPNTAEVLRRRFADVEDVAGARVGDMDLFARVPVVLDDGDSVLAAVPMARFGETREFTDEEISSVKFRFFFGGVCRRCD